MHRVKEGTSSACHALLTNEDALEVLTSGSLSDQRRVSRNRARVVTTLKLAKTSLEVGRRAPTPRRGFFATVTAQIGVGGMGEVYRAPDTNLRRQVAIKVLPASVAADAERLARFQREAEVLASLNHPHIAAIHGLERSGATTALVMELVEGPTLADRIEQGAIPLDEALPIGKQIAEALEAV